MVFSSRLTNGDSLELQCDAIDMQPLGIEQPLHALVNVPVPGQRRNGTGGRQDVDGRGGLQGCGVDGFEHGTSLVGADDSRPPHDKGGRESACSERPSSPAKPAGPCARSARGETPEPSPWRGGCGYGSGVGSDGQNGGHLDRQKPADLIGIEQVALDIPVDILESW